MYGLEVKGLAANILRARNIPRQLRFGAARAINETAFAGRAAFVAGTSRFDRVTPWIQKSFWVDKATPDRLEARVYPRNLGGKSVDPAKVLHAEVFGGVRRAKRSERAMQRVGILPPGFVMVPSKQLLGSDKTDGYGNVKGSFMVQLVAYFQAFGEQGYRSNMSARSVKRLARRGGPKVGPPRRFAHIAGVEYFVSYGRLRSPNPNSDAVQHLPAGIWQRSGTHGSDVKPVFLFVRQANYRVRLPLHTIFRETCSREFPRRFSTSVAQSVARPIGGSVQA